MAAALDEFELIERYFAPLAAGEPGAFALTDDAAILQIAPGRCAVVTTDAIVSGVHFPADEDPQAIASRLLRVNLSDLAAMGATPRAYTLALSLPARVTEQWVAAFAKGLAAEQRRFAITLIGGDTTRSDGMLVLSATLIGDAVADAILRRSGASAGDDVYVSGTIGDAVLGLALIEGRTTSDDKAAHAYLVERFRHAQPRVALGQGLAGLASAAADISDGLVADLNHICRASRLSAEIGLDTVPLSPAAERLVTDNQQLHLNLLTGGDDYELVFTAPASVSDQLARLATRCGVGITRIGRMGDRQPYAVTVCDSQGRAVEVGNGGYQHFRR